MPMGYLDFLVMARLGMDVYTFRNQPAWFIKQARSYILAEGIAVQKEEG